MATGSKKFYEKNFVLCKIYLGSLKNKTSPLRSMKVHFMQKMLFSHFNTKNHLRSTIFFNFRFETFNNSNF